MNSIPVEGPKLDGQPIVHVYLAMDGLPYGLVRDARAKGELQSDAPLALAALVPSFPAMSDLSWTRIMHTETLTGIELMHYDPTSDSVELSGHIGLAAHAVPPIERLGVTGLGYYHAFDYYASGYAGLAVGYVFPEVSFADSLDSLFIMLAGHAEHDDTFVAYTVEMDIFGHLRGKQRVQDSLSYLWKRIQDFKADHPERRYLFTIFSDHGTDFIPASPHEFIDFDRELSRLGVTPVTSFREGAATQGLFAVPIVHLPVTYIALHTAAPMKAEVARRAASSPYIDFACTSTVEGRFTVYQHGSKAVAFEYDKPRDKYRLDARDDFAAFGLSGVLGLRPEGDEHIFEATDEELFSAAAESPYPDFFFRIRTGLFDGAVSLPPDVLVAFRRPFASRGFHAIGGIDEDAKNSFHGNMDRESSMGVLLSEERELSPVVRSDNLMTMFPSLIRHLEKRGIPIRSALPGDDLDYDAMKSLASSR